MLLHYHSESGTNTRMPSCTTIQLRDFVSSLHRYTAKKNILDKGKIQTHWAHLRRGTLREMGSDSELTTGITLTPSMLLDQSKGHCLVTTWLFDCLVTPVFSGL
jgi:hypothetical protein